MTFAPQRVGKYGPKASAGKASASRFPRVANGSSCERVPHASIWPPLPGGSNSRCSTTMSTACGSSARRPESAEERSEEHTSELQSRPHLVCRLLLEKKKK